MKLDEVLVTPEEAKAKLDEYSSQIAEERTAEDHRILAGYRAAARGLQVIRLPATIGAGGWFEDSGLPKLAVVRATAKSAWCHLDGQDVVFADTDYWLNQINRGAKVNEHTVRVTVPADDRPAGYKHWGSSGRTIVPVIPPHIRPRPRRLRGFHILWEVEKWTPVPPRDPALIKWIRGDLWAVHACWDLTELERAVLSSRA
jgi:hypothetical protein